MTRQSIKQFMATLLCAVMVSSSLSISVLAEEPDAAPCEHSNTTIVEEAGTSASCTADGSHTVITVCADCGQELSRETVADQATGHDYQQTVTDPTCTEAGVITYTCSVCGDAYTEAGEAALGHDYLETGRVEPACGTAGSITYTCSRCGDSYTEEITALEHDYVQTVTEPTCTEDGIISYTCSVCGDTYTEAGEAALGHDYLETSRVEPACGQAGSVTYTCSRCGDSYTEELAALEHDYVQEVTEPTCTEDGIITYTCSICGDTYTEAGEAALGHDYLETERVEAACGQAGSITYTCSICGDTYTEEIAALEHDYAQTVTEPTCTEDGIITYTCSACGDTYTENGEAVLGHDYLETERVEATYDAEGSVTYTCSRCGDSYTEVLPQLEKPEVPFEQIEVVDGIQITVTAAAGVFDVDAHLDINKSSNSDFTGAAEAVLGIESSENVLIHHDVFGFSGAEMNGSAWVKLENMDLAKLQETYPEGTISVYVLRYDENAQDTENKAKRVSADVNTDRNTVSFTLSELGLYDVITVIHLPENDADLTNDEHGEPVGGEQGEPTNNEQGEPVNDEQGEPTNNEQGEPTNDEQGEPVNDEQGEPTNDEQGEPVDGEQGEPTNDEQGEPVNDEQGEPINDEQGEPVNDEQDKPIEVEQNKLAEEEQDEPSEEEQNVPAEKEQDEPAEEEQNEPAEEEQNEPAEEEQDELINNEQNGSENEQQNDPVVDDQSDSSANDQQKDIVNDDLEENEPQEIITIVTSEPIKVELDFDWDNEAHLDDYVQKLFDSGKNTKRGMLRSTSTVIANLSGPEAALYSLLKLKIEEIARGERASTQINIDQEALIEAGISVGPWTSDELGGKTVCDKAGLSDIDNIINALLSDCSAEMYWFGSLCYPGFSTAHSTYAGKTTYYLYAYNISFEVAVPYQDTNEFSVDSTRVQIAQAAFHRATQLAFNTFGTTLEKLQAFKEWICNAVEYDFDALEDTDQPDRGPWRLVNVFDNNPETNVVCEGYSKAFKYLCDLSNIPCILVSGIMSGGDGAGPHMWNIVTMDDDRNYLVDVTNCDSGTIGAPDKLFMAYGPSGSWDDAYSFLRGSIVYNYDDETLAIYSQDRLIISPYPYGSNTPDPNLSKYKVTIGSAEHGTVTTDNPYGNTGETVTLTCFPDEHFYLSGVSRSFSGTTRPTVSASGNIISVILGNSDVEITAEFSLVSGYSLVKFTSSDPDAVGNMAEEILPSGTIYTLPSCDFGAPDGKQFKEWSVIIGDDAPVTKAPYETITLTESTTITAVWETKSEPVFIGHAVLLTGQIGLQFFLQLPDGKNASDYPVSYVTFSGKKIDSTVQYSLPTSTAVINGTDTGRYLFTINLSSIQMADKITPTFHYMENNEEKAIIGAAFSVQDYIDWALDAITDSKTLRIIWSLADYGYFAQPYLARINGWSLGTDHDIMTTHVNSAYDFDAVKASAQGYAIVKSTSENIVDITYQLRFGSEISLRVFLTPAAGVTINSVLVDNQPITPSRSGDNYYIPISGINATELTRSHTIEVLDAAATVSPMSYVYGILNTEGTGKDARDLVCALLNYAEACKK